MADITWADVVSAAPDMATGVLAPFQTVILAMVEEIVNPESFGGDSSTTYSLARCLLAAHFGGLHKMGLFGKSGQVTSQSEGGVSQSFAAASAEDPLLDKTTYGQAFRLLVRRSPGRAGFVT